jgi:hypothetical protein
MLMDLLRSHALVHVSSLIPIVAMPCRDRIAVRMALLVSVVLNLAHIMSLSPFPEWQDLIWPVVSLVLNSVVLGRLALDRLPTALTPEERRLFSGMASLTPGEFRSFVKAASWRTAETATTLTEQAVVPASLYYVLSGALVVEKGERSFSVAAGTFIGEVAYLRRRPASATVTAQPGTRYLEWSVDALTRRIGRRRPLEQALLGLIALDMAAKVAGT